MPTKKGKKSTKKISTTSKKDNTQYAILRDGRIGTICETLETISTYGRDDGWKQCQTFYRINLNGNMFLIEKGNAELFDTFTNNIYKKRLSYQYSNCELTIKDHFAILGETRETKCGMKIFDDWLKVPTSILRSTNIDIKPLQKEISECITIYIELKKLEPKRRNTELDNLISDLENQIAELEDEDKRKDKIESSKLKIKQYQIDKQSNEIKHRELEKELKMKQNKLLSITETDLLPLPEKIENTNTIESLKLQIAKAEKSIEEAEPQLIKEIADLKSQYKSAEERAKIDSQRGVADKKKTIIEIETELEAIKSRSKTK